MVDSVKSQTRFDNHLLAVLPEDEYRRLRPYLDEVDLPLGQVLYEVAQPIEYLYFPTTSMVSLLNTLGDGMTAEVGLSGNDGVVGIAVFLGSETSTNRAVVQIAGKAVRLPANIVKEEFKRGETFQQFLLRYTQALITQISQTAICNRLHPVEQRFCRWLLLSHDRIKSNELVMTQELIASMLGGRRESVTVAAGRLQTQGLIHYVRGRINILDRTGLETSVCECYKAVRSEYARLLGWG